LLFVLSYFSREVSFCGSRFALREKDAGPARFGAQGRARSDITLSGHFCGAAAVSTTMVVRGDFEFKLVYADTKAPFIEHEKDGKAYFEVEPDVEYFIAAKKIGTGIAKDTIVKYYVDDQDLGYYRPYRADDVNSEPHLDGILEIAHGMSTTKALKFSKPKINEVKGGGGTNHSRLLMGKVEVRIYESIFDGHSQATTAFKSKVHVEDVDFNSASLAAKKSLRSGEGTNTLKPTQYSTHGGVQARYRQGTLIDCVDLTYCAALGLIEVGVLPKPPPMDHLRMLKPANPDHPSYRAAKRRKGTGTESDAIQIEDDE
jgi:hypothetical protein